jgi:hypothetical protein
MAQIYFVERSGRERWRGPPKVPRNAAAKDFWTSGIGEANYFHSQSKAFRVVNDLRAVGVHAEVGSMSEQEHPSFSRYKKNSRRKTRTGESRQAKGVG